MKWLEIIELRTLFNKQDKQKLLNLNFHRMAVETGQEQNQPVIKTFSHGTIETDYSIHLMFNSQQDKPKTSPLGLHLTSLLKEYGQVKHSIWIEESGYSKKY